VRGGADTAVTLLHLAGVLLHVLHELFQVLGRKVLAGDHDRGCMRGESDWREITFGIVLDAWREHRRGDVRAHAACEQGIAVRRRRCDARAADRAAGAADILDHHLLAERFRHAFRDDARDHVARSAGREGHHDRDRPGGVGLRKSRRKLGSGQARHHQRRRDRCRGPHGKCRHHSTTHH
jgi:hypothetical protein